MNYSLLNNPSAITQLLGLLATQPAAGQPGQAAPVPVAPMALPDGGPQVSMTPDVHAPPSFNLPSPRSLLDLSAMTPGRGADIPDNQNVAGRIHDWLQDRLVGERAPEAYGGLLSPTEIRNARPGLLGTIAGESWMRNLDHDAAVQREADAVGEEKRIHQSRQDLAHLFTPQPNETDDQRETRFTAMFDYAYRNGDLPMAKALEPFVRMLDKPPADHTYAPKPFKLPDGSVQWVTPGGPIPTGATPYHVPLRPANGGRTVGVAPAPIRTVETQLRDAREDLRRATTVKPPSLLATDDERAGYNQVQQAIPALKQKVDSLTSVRDNMATPQQGHTPAFTPIAHKAPPPPTQRSTVQSQDEYDHLVNDLHWPDAKIAKTYFISPTIKRVK